jgi:hypothetical protein
VAQVTLIARIKSRFISRMSSGLLSLLTSRAFSYYNAWVKEMTWLERACI